MNILKKNYKEKFNSAIFNIFEILIIVTSGIFMQVKLDEIIVLMCIFFVARMTCYNPMHYKSRVLCIIWSTAVFCSFFLLTKINLIIAISLTIFETVLLTGKGDINDGFMYRRNEEDKKYKELKRYVNDNKNTENLEGFENIIINFNKKYDDRYKVNLYDMYKLIFYEEMSYENVKREMNLRNDNHIIIHALDMIFICYDTYIESEGYYKKINKNTGLAKMS